MAKQRQQWKTMVGAPVPPMVPEEYDDDVTIGLTVSYLAGARVKSSPDISRWRQGSSSSDVEFEVVTELITYGFLLEVLCQLEASDQKLPTSVADRTKSIILATFFRYQKVGFSTYKVLVPNK